MPFRSTLKNVYDEGLLWCSQTIKLHTARPGVPLHFDVSEQECHQFLDTRGQPLSAGDLVQTPSGKAIIVGVFGGDIWFDEVPPETVTHDVNLLSPTGAWYIHRTEVSSSLTRLAPGAPSCPFPPPFGIEQLSSLLSPSGLTAQLDALVVRAVNSASSSFNFEPAALHAALSGAFPGDGRALEAGFARYFMLRRLNVLLQHCLPLINFSSPTLFVPGQVSTLASLLCHLRHLVFADVKLSFLDELLQASASPLREPDDDLNLPSALRVVKLSRRLALEAPESAEASERIKKSLFGQLVAALPARSADMLTLRAQWIQRGHRGQKRAFVVEYLGEGVSDYGGPYREVFSWCLKELHSATLPLLVPTPNQATQSGVDRHLWTFNPSQRDRQSWRYYFTFGQLVAIALRSGIEVELLLPSFVWRRLVGLPATPEDIVQIDVAAESMLKLSSFTDPEAFDDLCLEWVVMCSDRATHSIAPDPSLEGQLVTFAHRDLFVKRWFDARVNESAAQLNQFVSGFGSVVPLAALKTFTPAELEVRICGFSLDVELFASNTVYEPGYGPDTPTIQFFWEVLQDLPKEKQMEFLQFSLVRSRLPSAKRWPVPFRIQPLRHHGLNQDQFCPTVSTCFNTMTLPAYSSKDILRQKLLVAICCKTMNLDDRISTNW